MRTFRAEVRRGHQLLSAEVHGYFEERSAGDYPYIRGKFVSPRQGPPIPINDSMTITTTDGIVATIFSLAVDAEFGDRSLIRFVSIGEILGRVSQAA